MAQYWEDWSGSTLSAEPTGWTKRWVTTNITYTIEEDVDGPAGRRLRIVNSTTGRKGLSFDAVDGDATRATFKVRALIRTTAVASDISIGGVMGRGSGAAASEELYNHQFRHASTNERILRLVKYVSGSFTQIGTTVGSNIFEFDTLYWLGLEGDGDSLRWTLAAKDTPGTFIHDETTVDSSISAAGWIGHFQTAANTTDILAVGVGTDGDEAPLSDPSANTQSNSGSITGTGSLFTKTSFHTSVSGSLTGTGVLSNDQELTYVQGFDLENIDPDSVTITNSGTANPSVSATPRTQTMDTGTGWIHFLMQLNNADGRTPEFTITTTDRWLNSTYGAAWRPNYTYDFETWHQASAFTALTSPARVRFTFDEVFNQDTVWVADHPLFRMSQADTLATDLLNHASGIVNPSAGADASGVIGTSPAENDELSRAVGSHSIYGFKIEDTSQTPIGGGPKRVMVIESGMHSGEAVDGWHLKGMLDWILDDAGALSQKFRQNWKVFVYFNLTPNGRYGGHWRGNFRDTEDPNRDWVGVGSDSLAETVIVKDAITADGLVAGRWDVFFGLHSASDRNNTTNIFRTQDSDTALMDALKVKFDAVDSGTLNIVASVLTTTSAYYAVTNGARLSGVLEPGTRINPGNTRYQEVGKNYMISVQQMDDDGLFIPYTEGSITATGSLSTAIHKMLGGSITLRGSIATDPPFSVVSTKHNFSVGSAMFSSGFFRGRRFRLRNR